MIRCPREGCRFQSMTQAEMDSHVDYMDRFDLHDIEGDDHDE